MRRRKGRTEKKRKEKKETRREGRERKESYIVKLIADGSHGGVRSNLEWTIPLLYLVLSKKKRKEKRIKQKKKQIYIKEKEISKSEKLDIL